MLLSRSLYQLEYSSSLKSSPVFLIEPAPVTSLWSFLHTVPDHRRAQGKRHSLPTVLILTILALGCGCSSYQAITEWAINYQDNIGEKVPFIFGHTPDKATFHRIFAKLDYIAFEAVLSAWIQAITQIESGEGVSIDGKTTGRDTPHLVSAFAHKARSVLFQAATDTKGKELVVAPQILNHISVKGRVITADALHAQRDFCQAISQAGGGYVMVVKGNQSELQRGIRLFFEKVPFKSEIHKYESLDKTKGRVETRTTWMSDDPDLLKFLNWPGLTEVFKVRREISRGDTTTTEEVVGIARLLEGFNSVKHLNDYIRGHWSIENNLHRVRDTSFGEDKSTIRVGNAPKVMAALKNLVITLFQRGNVSSIPSAFRRFQAQPEELFVFLGLSQTNFQVIYA